MFQLPNLCLALGDYIQMFMGSERTIPFTAVDVWFKFHIQLHLAFTPHVILPSQIVQAYLPDDAHPWGNCDATFSQENPDSKCLI